SLPTLSRNAIWSEKGAAVGADLRHPTVTLRLTDRWYPLPKARHAPGCAPKGAMRLCPFGQAPAESCCTRTSDDLAERSRLARSRHLGSQRPACSRGRRL